MIASTTVGDKNARSSIGYFGIQIAELSSPNGPARPYSPDGNRAQTTASSESSDAFNSQDLTSDVHLSELVGHPDDLALATILLHCSRSRARRSVGAADGQEAVR